MHLDVFVRGASSVRLAGRVERDQSRAARTRFRYAESWLQAPDAFSIDPWNLPLDGPAPGLRGLRSICAAQGDCFRVGAAIRAHTGMPANALEYAVASPDDRVGFLAFGTGNTPCQLVDAGPAGFKPFPAGMSPRSDAESGADLVELGGEVRARFPASMSPDTRIVRVPRGDREWLLKMPRGVPDSCAMVEAACLDMAEECGIRVPRRMLVGIGAGFPVLATERFDRSPGRTLGMVSARDVDAVDTSYPGLVRALARVAGRDRRIEVFRRMAFNIAISNTDDHSGNHAFIRDVDGTWDLAPAFDLEPDLAPAFDLEPDLAPAFDLEPDLSPAFDSEPDLTSDGGHALAISRTVGGHGTDAIMAAAEEMGLSGSEASADLELVADVVSGWSSFLRNRGVEKRDIAIYERSFRPEALLPGVVVAMPGWGASLAA